MTSENEALELLRMAGVFFYNDPAELGENSHQGLLQTINLNDTWCWAAADGEYVPDADLPEVARLFLAYGWCGILYWASEKNDQLASKFHDVNRFIEFVRQEEAIRKDVPSDSTRAYHRCQYVIGA